MTAEREQGPPPEEISPAARRRAALTAIPPELLGAVVAFLREWLPPQARSTYRQMIAEDPEHWFRQPHFTGGIIPEHALRGNGITEKVLGVPDLEAVWPAILEMALQKDP